MKPIEIHLINMGFVREGPYYLNYEVRLRVRIKDDETLITYLRDAEGELIEKEATVTDLEEAIVNGGFGEY